MHGKRDIIILLSRRSIPVPAVFQIVAFDLIQTGLQIFRVIAAAVLLKRHIDQNHKKLPVAVRYDMPVDAVKPVCQVILSLLAKWFPDLFRRKDHSARDGRHFHEPLVVIRKAAPVFRVIRIGSVLKSLLVKFLKAVSSALPEGNQSPQRPGKCFHLDADLRISYSAVSQMQPGSALAVQWF